MIIWVNDSGNNPIPNQSLTVVHLYNLLKQSSEQFYYALVHEIDTVKQRKLNLKTTRYELLINAIKIFCLKCLGFMYNILYTHNTQILFSEHFQAGHYECLKSTHIHIKLYA